MYYGRQIGDGAISMMADDLEPYGFEAISEAAKKYRTNPKNRTFPLPASLIELINPKVITQRQSAIDLADKLISAVKKNDYTWNNRLNTKYTGGSFKDEFKSELGEISWIVVNRFGGWNLFCEAMWATNEGMFKAQLRDLVDSIIAKHEAGLLDEKDYLQIKNDFENTNSQNTIRLNKLISGTFK